jgi:hypothetical protein
LAEDFGKSGLRGTSDRLESFDRIGAATSWFIGRLHQPCQSKTEDGV